MSDGFISDEWRDKVEASVRWFKSPFSDDILLSHVETERHMTRVAGQTLATEVVNLQKELTKSAQATLQMAKIASDHKETVRLLQLKLTLATESLERIERGLTNNFAHEGQAVRELATETLREIGEVV